MTKDKSARSTKVAGSAKKKKGQSEKRVSSRRSSSGGGGNKGRSVSEKTKCLNSIRQQLLESTRVANKASEQTTRCGYASYNSECDRWEVYYRVCKLQTSSPPNETGCSPPCLNSTLPTLLDVIPTLPETHSWKVQLADSIPSPSQQPDSAVPVAYLHPISNTPDKQPPPPSLIQAILQRMELSRLFHHLAILAATHKPTDPLHIDFRSGKSVDILPLLFAYPSSPPKTAPSVNRYMHRVLHLAAMLSKSTLDTPSPPPQQQSPHANAPIHPWRKISADIVALCLKQRYTSAANLKRSSKIIDLEYATVSTPMGKECDDKLPPEPSVSDVPVVTPKKRRRKVITSEDDDVEEEDGALLSSNKKKRRQNVITSEDEAQSLDRKDLKSEYKLEHVGGGKETETNDGQEWNESAPEPQRTQTSRDESVHSSLGGSAEKHTESSTEAQDVTKKRRKMVIASDDDDENRVQLFDQVEITTKDDVNKVDANKNGTIESQELSETTLKPPERKHSSEKDKIQSSSETIAENQKPSSESQRSEISCTSEKQAQRTSIDDQDLKLHKEPIMSSRKPEQDNGSSATPKDDAETPHTQMKMTSEDGNKERKSTKPETPCTSNEQKRNAIASDDYDDTPLTGQNEPVSNNNAERKNISNVEEAKDSDELNKTPRKKKKRSKSDKIQSYDDEHEQSSGENEPNSNSKAKKDGRAKTATKKPRKSSKTTRKTPKQKSSKQIVTPKKQSKSFEPQISDTPYTPKKRNETTSTNDADTKLLMKQEKQTNDDNDKTSKQKSTSEKSSQKPKSTKPKQQPVPSKEILNLQDSYTPQSKHDDSIKQLFADDFNVVSFTQDSSSRRSKRQLRTVLRYEPGKDHAKKKRKSADETLAIGEGFECPQCDTWCFYDTVECPECQLKCRYVAGTGVVVYRDRTEATLPGVVTESSFRKRKKEDEDEGEREK